MGFQIMIQQSASSQPSEVTSDEVLTVTSPMMGSETTASGGSDTDTGTASDHVGFSSDYSSGEETTAAPSPPSSGSQVVQIALAALAQELELLVDAALVMAQPATTPRYMQPHVSHQAKLDAKGRRHRGQDGLTFGERNSTAILDNLRPGHHAPKSKLTPEQRVCRKQAGELFKWLAEDGKAAALAQHRGQQLSAHALHTALAGPFQMDITLAQAERTLRAIRGGLPGPCTKSEFVESMTEHVEAKQRKVEKATVATARGKENAPGRPSIYDKLTDTGQYTGAHRLRFDRNGKGKGAAGRTYAHEQVRHAGFAGIMNRKAIYGLDIMPAAKKAVQLHKREEQTATAQDAETVQARGEGEGGLNWSHASAYVSDDLVTRMQALLAGRSPPRARPPTTAVRAAAGTANSSAGGASIFDKLTDPSKFTGAHKERFDKDGKGKGKAGRTLEHEQWAGTGIAGFMNRKPANIRGVTKTDHGDSVASLSKISAQSQAVYDKLTDPKMYTGSHRERFDKHGKGRGIVGRTDEHEQWAADGIAGFLNRKPANVRGETANGHEDSVATLAMNVGSPAIFDKLTDASQFTGTHQHRFDIDPVTGKSTGKGIAGRTYEGDQWAGGRIEGFLNRKPADVRGLTTSVHRPPTARNKSPGRSKSSMRAKTPIKPRLAWGAGNAGVATNATCTTSDARLSLSPQERGSVRRGAQVSQGQPKFPARGGFRSPIDSFDDTERSRHVSIQSAGK